MKRSPDVNTWTAVRANAWYQKLPWLVGCNYTPRTAINQLEMWQQETFDPATIDQELGWAKSVGMNGLRVFLHDLCWQQDRVGFLGRIERFLDIADRHRMGTMFVFFDSVWHPFPRAGRQPEPEPGVHNSGWVQSPGVEILRDVAAFDRLEEYVRGVVRHFRTDQRVHAWDIWNEPDNNNPSSRGCRDIPNKAEVVQPLIERAFGWARSARPTQPLTSGIWMGDWSCEDTLKPHERTQLIHSDVISFHCYGSPNQIAAKVEQLKRYGRPLLCTEYMARGMGSTLAGILPGLKEHHVGAYQWGLVKGKTQCHIPWDSWQRPYVTGEPEPWHHDIFREDGTPYDPADIQALKKATQRRGQRTVQHR